MATPNTQDGRHDSLRRLSQSIVSEAVEEATTAASNTTASIPLGDPMNVSWLDVGLKIKPGKPSLLQRFLHPSLMKRWREEEGDLVLDGMLGEVQAGEMIAILGESGAGKTKLLEVLAGKLVVGEPIGLVSVNGKERVHAGWSRLVSYIDVRDWHDPELTVSELVVLACRLKLDSIRFTRDQKERMAGRLVKAVGLAHRADHRSKYLSTGEKRRLSIAVELAAQRQFICIDEPTGGLDSSTALRLVRMLHGLVREYRLTLICVIHQPRDTILALFDRLLLLSRGRPVYYGSLAETLEYLQEVTSIPIPSRENPADYILDMISIDRLSSGTRRMSETRFRNFGREWSVLERDRNLRAAAEKVLTRRRRSRLGDPENVLEHGRHSRHASSLFQSQTVDPETEEDGENLKNPAWPIGPWEEFCLLLKRFSLGKTRDIRGALIYFLAFTILALFHGFLFFQLTLANFGGFQSRLGLMICIPGVMMTVLVGELMGELVTSRDIIRVERASHTYRIWTAYPAKFISLLPLRLFTFTVFSTICYYLCGLRTDSFVYYLIFIGFTWLALLVFMGLAGILATFDISLLGLYIGTAYFALSGLPVRITDVTPILSWLRFLSPAYYCLSGLIQNEASGLTFGDGVTGDEYIELFALNETSVIWCAGALLITALGYFFIGLYGLDHVTKPRFRVL